MSHHRAGCVALVAPVQSPSVDHFEAAVRSGAAALAHGMASPDNPVERRSLPGLMIQRYAGIQPERSPRGGFGQSDDKKFKHANIYAICDVDHQYSSHIINAYPNAKTFHDYRKMIDEEKIIKDAVRLVENDGIVFIDEIDKICNRASNIKGGDVSREGVQRDLLPLIEVTTSVRIGLPTY